MEEIKVNIDGKDHVVKIEDSGSAIKLHLDGKVYTVETSLKKEQPDFSAADSAETSWKGGTIRAAMPGVIFSVDVKSGEAVKKGQKLLSLIAMKLENQILSPIDGKVKEIKVKKDDRVNKLDVLMIIE